MNVLATVEPARLLYPSSRYPDVKDPSVVYDGRRWHLFGTGCGLAHGLDILHATAAMIEGPWHEEPPVNLLGVDAIPFPAAPGVAAEGSTLHMFLQHDFNILGGHVEHLVSHDGGRTFAHRATALESQHGTAEAGVYDPDPAVIRGARYLTYAAMSVVGQPDLFLARSESGTWDGPWERLGCIVHHEQVDMHNQIGDADYEWGLEGPQLVELPDGRCLLSAVCFLSAQPHGSRQRLLFAIADDPEGPYTVLGPLIPPASDAGENGHGTAYADGDAVHVLYQERAGHGRPWHYRRAVARFYNADADDFEATA